jgi:hypothetical protein
VADNRVITRYEADVSDHVSKLQRLGAAQSGFAKSASSDWGGVSKSADAASEKFESFGARANKALGAIKVASFISAFAQVREIANIASVAFDALADALGATAVNWDKVHEAQRKQFDWWQKNYIQGSLEQDVGSSRAEHIAAATGKSFQELLADPAGLHPMDVAAIQNELDQRYQDGLKIFGKWTGLHDQWEKAKGDYRARVAVAKRLAQKDAEEFRALQEVESAPNLTVPGRGPVGAVSTGYESGLLGGGVGMVTPETAERFGIAGESWQPGTGGDAEYEAFRQRTEGMYAYQAAMDGLTQTMGTFQSASSAAFAAWIDGSESMGKAFKKVFAASLAATASDMFGKAIYHAAAAIGSAAFLDWPGAARHGKAAAAYGAGAVILGGLAKGLGGGGASSGSGGGGGSAPNFATGGGGQQGGGGVTVILGDDWADDSASSRQRRAHRQISQAMRDGAGQESGVYRG